MTWKYDGYIRWLHGTFIQIEVVYVCSRRIAGLAVQYKARRDFFIDCLADEFHFEPSSSEISFWKGCQVFDAYPKQSGKRLFMSEKGLGTKLFSFVPPSSGMFIWVRPPRY